MALAHLPHRKLSVRRGSCRCRPSEPCPSTEGSEEVEALGISKARGTEKAAPEGTWCDKEDQEDNYQGQEQVLDPWSLVVIPSSHNESVCPSSLVRCFTLPPRA